MRGASRLHPFSWPALLVIDSDGYSNDLVALADPDDVAVPAKATSAGCSSSKAVSRKRSI
ncbi:hypothetical protein APA44_04355 [Pseudomonas aeruginosa]|uniref:Uncharacterized protein n=1 Tax=Pseudomonas paraeruginosa TaxID=2994495 RepID=A0A2R3IT06_9PSED|nr:hypothetical protein CSB93_4062 [Pseudomonas paraeruginosa]KRU94819.1 hypothetical protein AN454_11655 [Pseudomonas aeruginosa]AWE91394.1 hypothetical protein CSC28_2846 [Pseudomonas paraeruginosa]KSC43703.1 hypothetical protein AO882_20630 [Pseudomonas paraeruginosa]KSD62226.1 hypothetical protein AO903_31060 [Pseudomonas aeruginosa]